MTRRTTLTPEKPITCDGETKLQSVWGRELGGTRWLVSNRINQLKWPACKAATMPLNLKISSASKLAAKRRAMQRVVLRRGLLRPKAR